MDYGIRWDSGPESPLSLSGHDTSSFHHVRQHGGVNGRIGILRHTHRASILPRGVHGDLSQCLRSRVFSASLSNAPRRPSLGRRGLAHGIPIPDGVDSGRLAVSTESRSETCPIKLPARSRSHSTRIAGYLT